jgi:TolA-binding protein
MTDPQLTDDDIAQAARAAPVAQRSAADVERAAERFATATQERAVRKTRSPARGARVPLWMSALVVVAVTVGAFVAGRVSSGEMSSSARAVEVHGAPGATLDRVESGSVRAARLYEGSATFAVPPTSPTKSERFLVVTGDAEVQGAGLFEVTATGDRLARVRVLDGAASVKTVNGALTSVTPTEAWTPKTDAVVAPSADGARDRLNAALALLSSGDLDKAAAAFKAEELVGSPVLEDATFWEGIALSRARQPEGRAALESFLARFPKSQHRAEALGVLGWQLLDASDARGAEAAFREAAKSDDARVRESAEAGLHKLGSK